jgi:HlyD family secretion protein
MASRYAEKSTRSIWLLLVVVMTVTAAGWSAAEMLQRRKAHSAVESFDWVVVKREDLDTTVLAGGDLQPAKQTTVRCQVEDVTDSDGTMILTVIKNGSPVKKGDEICRLDSAPLDELARDEEILVHQARALWRKAQLELETSKLALLEYEAGRVAQTTKEFDARIALGRSDVQRQQDRLAWAEAMAVKGYLAEGQLLSERQTLGRVRHDLAKAEGECRLFRQFHAPKEIHVLRGRIMTAENNFRLETDRLNLEEDELAYLRKQIANCTIRAPQDGVVVHANGGYWWMRPLEPGTRAIQDQPMFLIPDLTQMEVDVSLHETMGPRVRLGMRAQVTIASAQRAIPGRVVAMNMMPISNWKEWDDNLKHFIVRVRLDHTPASALPFMSATVEIDTGKVSGALAIPVEAMAIVDGEESCYVVADDGLRRRPITTRRTTRDLLEITGGLREGERVISRSVDADARAVRELLPAPTNDVATDQSPFRGQPTSRVPSTT